MSLTTTSPVLVVKVTLPVCINCEILRSLCGSRLRALTQCKRVFLDAVSRVLNVPVFINPQLFPSSQRKKRGKKSTELLHSCLEISCSDHSYVQFPQPCPLCVVFKRICCSRCVELGLALETSV